MPTPWHYENGVIRIRKFCVGPLENNVYVVACAETARAVVIDAAAEADRIVAETADVAPQAILTTHGHSDHVQAAAEVAARLDVPFRIHPADAITPRFEPFVPIEPDEVITVGRAALRAVPTPGHTPGSVSYTAPGVVFTGDTLFPGGPGATDGGASFTEIIASIRERLLGLADDTLVMPGHGLDTTIGVERPHLPVWETRGW